MTDGRMTDIDLLVIGLGNVLLADDGAGVEAARRLMEVAALPGNAEVLDGGTLGLSLLPRVREARSVIILDAVKADAPPGTVVRLEGDALSAAISTRLSPHQVGVADLIEGARLLGGLPERVVMVGVVPEKIALGVELSPAVEAAMPLLVEAALDECAAQGFPAKKVA